MTVATVDSLVCSLGWGHEQVHLLNDARTGLEAVIAIHSTALGPALGGLRLRPYPGGMAEALDDALQLSRAMTLKAAAAGLDLGGGKAVVLDDGDAASRTLRLSAMAREIDRLGGAYITAEDVGTTTADMDLIAAHTSHERRIGRLQTERGRKLIPSINQSMRGDQAGEERTSTVVSSSSATSVYSPSSRLSRRVG